MYWFIAAFLLVAAELLTGTFYLLMIALGAAAGGLASLAGLEMVGQFLVATAVSIAGVTALRWRGFGLRRAGERSNLAFDAGQPVEVVERKADGLLRVAYRGTQWDAELAEGAGDGPYMIKETRGTRLVLAARRQG